jgi:hypothetical protein
MPGTLCAFGALVCWATFEGIVDGAANSPAKRRRSAPCDVKRYLQRAQLAALFDSARTLDEAGIGSLVAGLFQAIALDVQDLAEERIAVHARGAVSDDHEGKSARMIRTNHEAFQRHFAAGDRHGQHQMRAEQQPVASTRGEQGRHKAITALLVRRYHGEPHPRELN